MESYWSHLYVTRLKDKSGTCIKGLFWPPLEPKTAQQNRLKTEKLPFWNKFKAF